MSISWNTGLAAERARHNLKLNKKRRPAAKAASAKRQAPSFKLQASSATKKTQLNDTKKNEKEILVVRLFY